MTARLLLFRVKGLCRESRLECELNLEVSWLSFFYLSPATFFAAIRCSQYGQRIPQRRPDERPDVRFSWVSGAPAAKREQTIVDVRAFNRAVRVASLRERMFRAEAYAHDFASLSSVLKTFQYTRFFTPSLCISSLETQ